MPEFDKSAVLERLTRLDGDLFAIYGTEQRFEVVIVGGSALMMTDLAPAQRFTRDIDILKSSQEAESLLDRYDMNTNVSLFFINIPKVGKPVECASLLKVMFLMSIRCPLKILLLQRHLPGGKPIATTKKTWLNRIALI